MAAESPSHPGIFAANRAVGRIKLAVAAGAGGTRRKRVHEAGSLRVRFPNGDGQTLDAVIVNVAGGMTGGDRFDIDVRVDAGAKMSMTTAAAEKIYRSLDPPTEIAIKLEVASGGTLAWLPQETILFDRARLSRTIEVDLAAKANLLLAEACVFGRSAMGETVMSGRCLDRWRVRVQRKLIFAESVRIDGAIADCLMARASAAGGTAIASVLKIPGDEDAVAVVDAMQREFAGEVGVSTWNGLTLARLVARDGAALRHDLVQVVTAFAGASPPRLWLN